MPFPDNSIAASLPIQVTLTPNSSIATPVPIQVTLTPTSPTQEMPLIPRRGTIPISGSVTFITPSSHVRRYSILISSQRDCTLIIRERIDTIEGAGVFIQVASVAVPGVNAPFTHTGELLGNMLEVVLLNGTAGSSIYDISMLGHVT